MALFEPITTSKAPAAIGTYSQAVRYVNTVYLSGQIPLHPATMELVSEAVRDVGSRERTGCPRLGVPD